jgi:hypothetical protein
MYVFKEIDKASTIIERNVVNYTHNLNTSSLGIKSINIVSASISSSYWDSFNVLFYASGSPVYPNELKFAMSAHSFAESDGKQHLTKFHGYPSSSIITIPQEYYGEKIKEGSFKLVDKSFTDNAGNNPVIKDDTFGNLYSSNAHYSQSVSAPSSSANYVGNIFYDLGFVIITENDPWSGSVKYSDITKGTNFDIKLESYNTITTHEYSVTLKPHEFNHSMNYSLKMPLSGSYNTYEEFTSSILSTPYIAADFTGSEFSPYVTGINLYQYGEMVEPVITANFAKPIKKSKKISETFKIRLDL